MKSCLFSLARLAVASVGAIVLYLTYELVAKSREISHAGQCLASDNSIACEGPLYMAGFVAVTFVMFVLYTNRAIDRGSQ